MIKREYFYQVDTMQADSKFMWGIISVKSWMPNPSKATRKIMEDIKNETGATDRQVKFITFNRV